MAKNRRKKNKLRVRNRQYGVRSIFPGTLFGVLMTLTVFALSYLYLCGRCDALGKKINQLEKSRDNLRREIVNEEYKWSNMTSPDSMEKLLKKHNLVMTWPSEGSVVRLRRNPLPQQFARHPSMEGLVDD
jgi:hypothetical protein